MTVLSEASSLLHRVVGAEAAPRSVIVQGWAAGGEEAPLREALTAALSSYGRVSRLEFADEKRTAAVVVFEEEAAAARAVHFTGPVLGAAVMVAKPVTGTGTGLPISPGEEEERLLGAEAIGGEEQTAEAAAAAPALPPLAHLAADTCATALAESFLLAQKGLHAAKELDGKVGVSRRLEPVAEKLTTKAQELDDKLKLREGIRDTADRAKETAAVLSGRAAEAAERVLRQNPALAQGAQKTAKVFKMAEVWGKRTLDAAKEKIESRGGVLPGSARGEGPGGVAMDEYEPLVSSNAEAAAVPSPGEEEVPIQL